MNENISELFDKNQLKEYLDISDTAVYNLLRNKKFPSFKVGGVWRVKKSNLIEWMNKQTKK